MEKEKGNSQFRKVLENYMGTDELKRQDELNARFDTFFKDMNWMLDANWKLRDSYQSDRMKYLHSLKSELDNLPDSRTKLAFILKEKTHVQDLIIAADNEDHGYDKNYYTSLLDKMLLPWEKALTDSIKLEDGFSLEAVMRSGDIQKTEKKKNSERRSVPGFVQKYSKGFVWSDPRLPEIIASILVSLKWVRPIQEALLTEFLKRAETLHRIEFLKKQKNLLFTAFYDLLISGKLQSQKKFLALAIADSFTLTESPVLPLADFTSVYDSLNEHKSDRRVKINSEKYVNIVTLIEARITELDSII